jgi:hypothetical protein
VADNTPGGLQRLADGHVVVDIRLTDTSQPTLAQLAHAGATVRAVSRPLGTVTATVAPGQLAGLEAMSQVKSVREDLEPVSSACTPVVSQGDTVLAADQARTNFGVNGTGQTVGVLSDSFNSLGGASTDVAGGELPGPGNPCGFAAPVDNAVDQTGTDEGRAMAQIVHGLAPGAHLAFEDDGTSDVSMANNIDDLRINHGATVLVDDITYPDEPFYQDGPIANAVTRARAANVPYFSSAGNSNITLGGHDVGSLEALHYQPDANCFVGYLDCHNFSPTNAQAPNDDPGSGYSVRPGRTLTLDLQWAQPWGAVSTDYDLAIVDQNFNVLASSTIDNIADQVPFELASFQNTLTTDKIVFAVVARFAGPATRFKIVNLGRQGSVDSAQFLVTQGNNTLGPTIFGHNGSSNAYSVAAANWATPSTPETFSSKGPVNILFQPVPGTALLPHAQVLNKPDFTAVDCVSTSFAANSGFSPFCGTSAAAPHAAAIAALLLQEKPITAAQVGGLMTATATPFPANFTPSVVGSGLLNALNAMRAIPQPYHPLPPARITDTRPNSGFPNAGATLRPGHETLNVQVTGAGGVPPEATAAVLNVTVTGATGTSFLTVWPTGARQPNASNLNFGAGQTVANLVQVGLSTNGQVTLFNAGGSVNVVVDVEGYVAPSATTGTGLYNPLPPARITDTRPNSGFPHAGETQGPGGVVDVQVTGVGMVPAQGVHAVVLNVTATGPTQGGFLTAWPAGAQQPTASNLNFAPGQTVPNRVIVPVGAGGKVSIFNGFGSVNVIVDVGGYFTDDSNPSATGTEFTPIVPERITDTRSNSGLPNAGKTLGPGRQTLPVQVEGAGEVPATGLTGAVLNVTVTGPTQASFLTVWPSELGRPTASDLNWAAGQTVPNLVVVGNQPAFSGIVDLFNGFGSVNVVVDVTGWYW